MGTSSSSSGPAAGVALVPPWVPEAGQRDRLAKQDAVGRDAGTAQIAPAARFGGARRHLGEFGRGGGRSALRRGMAGYVAKGLGGSKNAARRMGGATARSGALYDVLHSLSAKTFDPAALGFDAAGLAGRTAREIVDRVARFVSPSDGTQDAESSQRAVNAALSDLLAKDDSVDVTSLNAQQIDWVLERHIVYEIFQRVQLDVGKAIVENAPSPSAAIDRLDEMRGYIEETVASAFRARRKEGRPVDRGHTTKLMASVVQDTFAVFEEYLE